MHEEWVWYVYDGQDKLLPWTPNQAKEWWDFYKSSKYTKKLINKFGLEGAKTSKTLMANKIKLNKDEQGINVDIKLYRSMISSLL